MILKVVHSERNHNSCDDVKGEVAERNCPMLTPDAATARRKMLEIFCPVMILYEMVSNPALGHLQGQSCEGMPNAVRQDSTSRAAQFINA